MPRPDLARHVRARHGLAVVCDAGRRRIRARRGGVRRGASPDKGEAWSLRGRKSSRLQIPLRHLHHLPLLFVEYDRIFASNEGEMVERLNRTHPVRGPAGASRCARACKTAPAVLWQPRISTAQTPCLAPTSRMRAGLAFEARAHRPWRSSQRPRQTRAARAKGLSPRRLHGTRRSAQVVSSIGSQAWPACRE